MGHSLSADKRERQNIKRNQRNRANIAELRREIKRIKAEAAKGGDVKKLLAEAFSAYDTAARKNTIPKARADRRKSRIALELTKALGAKK